MTTTQKRIKTLTIHAGKRKNKNQRMADAKPIKKKVTKNDIGNTYCPTCGNEVVDIISFTDRAGVNKVIMVDNCPLCGENISSQEDKG